MPHPLEFDLDRTRGLRIQWSDGSTGDIPLAALRRACPCATCRAEREERSRNPLAVVAPVGDQSRMVTAETAELTGHYALRVVWKDGHNTGIYNFALLYELCQQAAAAGARRTGKASDNPGSVDAV